LVCAIQLSGADEACDVYAKETPAGDN
jgi:hypothetical protein